MRIFKTFYFYKSAKEPNLLHETPRLPNKPSRDFLCGRFFDLLNSRSFPVSLVDVTTTFISDPRRMFPRVLVRIGKSQHGLTLLDLRPRKDRYGIVGQSSTQDRGLFPSRMLLLQENPVPVTGHSDDTRELSIIKVVDPTTETDFSYMSFVVTLQVMSFILK